MIVQRDKILQIYDNFKDLFQTYFGGDKIDFKHISTQMLSNIEDWKLFFKIINLIIEKENIDYNNKTGLLKIILNKQIINNRPELIFSKIANWINEKKDTYYYSYEQYIKDMQNLLVLISEFVDNYDIEISIIKKENLKLFFKEEISIEIENEFNQIDKLINENQYITVANKIENLYANYFLKHFFKEQKNIDKKEVINLISNKNKILEEVKTIEEFNNIFSLISKIRNAIKGKNKTSNDKTTNLINNNFWNNSIITEKERKSFLKLYVDFSKTLFNFLINISDLK